MESERVEMTPMLGYDSEKAKRKTHVERSFNPRGREGAPDGLYENAANAAPEKFRFTRWSFQAVILTRATGDPVSKISARSRGSSVISFSVRQGKQNFPGPRIRDISRGTRICTRQLEFYGDNPREANFLRYPKKFAGSRTHFTAAQRVSLRSRTRRAITIARGV